MSVFQAIITRHPGKSIWVLLAAGFNLVRLPIWLLRYLPASSRPTRKWSYMQAIRWRVMNAFLTNMVLIDMKSPESLKAGKEGKQFVIIDPAPDECYKGIVRKDLEIKPRAIGGTWYPAPLERFSGEENVVLHFHGGAFMIGNGRKDDAGYLTKTLLENTSATHIFCPQYRLSSNPLGRFPAALQDAITSIQHVTQALGVPKNRLTISGDSAGGNIALALLRYIHDQPEAHIPSPGSALLWSPWVDPSRSLIPGSFKCPSDFVSESFGHWGAKAYEPSETTGITLLDPQIRFVDNPFPTPTPLFFSAGECEALYSDVIKTYEAFKTVPGNHCELDLQEGATHDAILVAPLSGWYEAAEISAKAAGKFLDDLQT